MSLETIGSRVGNHPSTVSYWLRKHGLTACRADLHSPKGGLEKGQLVSLVEEGLTLREIAGRLNRSVATVRHWMDRYDLRTGPVSPGSPKRIQRQCRRHGLTEFVREGRGYYRLSAVVPRRSQKGAESSSGRLLKRREVAVLSVGTIAASRHFISITSILRPRNFTSAMVGRYAHWHGLDWRPRSASCFAATATQRSRLVWPSYR
jgi:transposase